MFGRDRRRDSDTMWNRKDKELSKERLCRTRKEKGGEDTVISLTARDKSENKRIE